MKFTRISLSELAAHYIKISAYLEAESYKLPGKLWELLRADLSRLTNNNLNQQ